MAKELHIKIDDVIGAYTDCYGFLYVGYMSYNFEGALEANPDAEHLVIHMDTPGGCTWQGQKIFNSMQAFKEQGGTIEVIGEGLVASMGTFLMQGATPGMRKMRRASNWNVHMPYDDRGGNSKAHKKYARELEMLDLTFAHIYSQANTAGKTKEEILADMEQDLFATPEYALQMGYIDEILDSAPAIAVKEREGVKAMALYTPNPDNQTIEMTETQQKSFAQMLAAEIKSLFTPKAEAETPGTGGAPETTAAAEEVPAPVALDKETVDGTKLRIEGTELVVGALVFVVTEEGESPAPDAAHELTTGETITTVAGAITEVTPAIEAQTRKFTNQITALQSEVQAFKARAEAAEKKAQQAIQPPAPSGKLEQGTPQNMPVTSGAKALSPLDKVAEQIKNNRKHK